MPQGRYTTPRPIDHQFFHFPSLAVPSEASDALSRIYSSSQAQSRDVSSATNKDKELEDDNKVSQQPPPTAPIYWTSPATRRLEYAAIDAASQGVRGFFVRLIPDCILPSEFRSYQRSRFHDDEGRDSDAGSVRRYRICIEDEEQRSASRAGKRSVREMKEPGTKRPSFLRRFTSLGGKWEEELKYEMVKWREKWRMNIQTKGTTGTAPRVYISVRRSHNRTPSEMTGRDAINIYRMGIVELIPKAYDTQVDRLSIATRQRGIKE
jgi:hypothetical protein